MCEVDEKMNNQNFVKDIGFAEPLPSNRQPHLCAFGVLFILAINFREVYNEFNYN